MPLGFPGFPREGIDFLRSLARNNRREWFQPRKAIFEEHVKEPMAAFVEALDAAMVRFAPEYVTDPGDAIYRFYRDTRFSKDKSPYKDHIAANFPRRGMARHGGAGFYVAVSHKEVGIGGGVYMPDPETLRAIRNCLGERHADFRRLTGSARVRKLFGELQGDRLSRVPKGFLPDHPGADLLRFKQYLLYIELPPEIATTPELFAETLKRFQAMAPFIDFLNAPLSAPRRKLDAHDLFL